MRPLVTLLLDRLARPAGLAMATVALAGGLLAVGWYDYTATRSEFMRLVRAHAESVRHAVGAAARASRAAARLAEDELGERLLDNARLLAELDRRDQLTASVLDEFTTRNHLFRVMVLAADGARQLQAGGPGAGPGPPAGRGPHAGRGTGEGALGRGPGGTGAGPGGGALLDELLSGRRDEGVTAMHQGRWEGAARRPDAIGPSSKRGTCLTPTRGDRGSWRGTWRTCLPGGRGRALRGTRRPGRTDGLST